MIKIIPINKKFLKIFNDDIFKSLSVIFNKKVSNQEEIFSLLRKNPKLRSSVFDILNMLPSLNMINYEIKKIIQNKFAKKYLINWTYAQIRLDDNLSKEFSAPAHKDRWIIDKNKVGYVAWIPLKKEGSSLLVSSKDKTKKIIKNKYWGLEAKGNNAFKRKKIKYGQALIFDPDLLHKSDYPKYSRITLQLRYEEINPIKFRRSVTQKVDSKVLRYWKNKLT